MSTIHDGPRAARFRPCPFPAPTRRQLGLPRGSPDEIRAALPYVPTGEAVSWGIPFLIGDPVLLDEAHPATQPVALNLGPVTAGWLVFCTPPTGARARPTPAALSRPCAGWASSTSWPRRTLCVYADGAEERAHPPPPPDRRVPAHLGRELLRGGGPPQAAAGARPPRADGPRLGAQPDARHRRRQGPGSTGSTPGRTPTLTGHRRPAGGAGVRRGGLLGLAAGEAATHPLRWEPRRKALLTLPAGEPFQPRARRRRACWAGAARSGTGDLGATPRRCTPTMRGTRATTTRSPSRLATARYWWSTRRTPTRAFTCPAGDVDPGGASWTASRRRPSRPWPPPRSG